MAWTEPPNVMPVDMPIGPRDPLDSYPSHLANYGRGGFHSYATLAERNAIPSDRMEIGMGCYVLETGKDYRLTDLSPVTWEEFTGTGGGGAEVTVVDGGTADDTGSDIYDGADADQVFDNVLDGGDASNPVGGSAVDSVNGLTGAVVLTASDVGAASATHASTHAAAGSDPLTLALSQLGTIPSNRLVGRYNSGTGYCEAIQLGAGFSFVAGKLEYTPSASDQDAINVTFTPAGNVAATNVQDAIEELDSEKASAAALTAGLSAKQDADGDLTTIAGLTPSNDDFLQRKSGAWANRTVAQVKSDLGLSGTNSGDQNTFGTIAVSGQSDVVADAAGDTLTLVAGSNITITTNASTDTITIAASGSGGGTKTYARFTPLDNCPPTSNYATLDTRNAIPVLDFDASTDESATFVSVVPEAASLGSGLKVRVHWMATSATSGDVVWGAQVERMNTDLDADSFDTAATATGTASGTSGIITVTEITITTIDSVAAGESFRLKVYRAASNGSDTMTGDAELVSVEVRSAA